MWGAAGAQVAAGSPFIGDRVRPGVCAWPSWPHSPQPPVHSPHPCLLYQCSWLRLHFLLIIMSVTPPVPLAHLRRRHRKDVDCPAHQLLQRRLSHPLHERGGHPGLRWRVGEVQGKECVCVCVLQAETKARPVNAMCVCVCVCVCVCACRSGTGEWAQSRRAIWKAACAVMEGARARKVGWWRRNDGCQLWSPVANHSDTKCRCSGPHTPAHGTSGPQPCSKDVSSNPLPCLHALTFMQTRAPMHAHTMTRARAHLDV